MICPEDDVIDYMVMEAVAIKVGKADEAERDQKQRNEWKDDLTNLEQFR